MLLSRWRASAVAALLAMSAAVGAQGLPADLGAKLARSYISPAMNEFERSAIQLRQKLESWCADPDNEGVATLHDHFADVLRAWSRVEFLRFGPLVADNRYERVFFWPDPRGIMPRQVQRVLGGDGVIPDAAKLSTHSVAMQGLPALEYVLYKEEGGLLASPMPEGVALTRACHLATAMAANVSALGGELAYAWGDSGKYASQFANSSSSNPLYRNEQEVAAEAIKALSTGLQFARDVKLVPMLGANAARANYKRAPFWRSGLSATAMAAAVDGMLQFYKAAGYQYASDEQWVDESLPAELERARTALLSAQTPGPGVAATDESYQALVLASLILKNAKGIVDEHVAPAIGVRIGFNALDGD